MEDLSVDRKNSLHGSLLKECIKKWFQCSLFEINDNTIRAGLLQLINEKLKIEKINIQWRDTSESIDIGEAKGVIFFIDEDGINKYIEFILMPNLINFDEKYE